MVQNLDGYCPFELKAGLGVLGAGLGVQGAQAVRRAALGVRALAGAWARGRASGRVAGRTVRAGHGRQAARARSLCAQAGPGWGFVHSDSVFLARFDSVVS